jgi:hypothetical protein
MHALEMGVKVQFISIVKNTLPKEVQMEEMVVVEVM